MTTEPGSSTTEFPSSTGFVGRRQELGALRSALAEALAGQGRLVMLAGEPGIGKTRLAQELAAYAQTRSAQALWGRCYEGEGAPPYWPWVQPLKTYLERTSPEELRADLGPGASDLGELLPELREKLPGLESPPALEPEQARFRLFNSVTTFLKNLSQRKPLVLVLDDLHWADRSSLLLLQFLSQQLGDSPLLVLGTYRDVEVNPQHPLSDTLAQLSREPVFRRQSLQGLSLEDAGAFMELTAGMRPTQQLINTVYSRTEGNPFFTAEVVRLLSERGALQEAAGVEGVASAIPVGVLEVIGRRINRLSSQCHQTLTTAAVMGREFDFRLLETLRGGASEEELLDVIDEALEAHLIEELPQGRERYQFCHALIQETLTQQLSSSRKVRQHARIAEALEELYGNAADAHAAELAHHFAEAEPVLGPEMLVHYSLLAGERALAAYAWEEALGYFDRGLAAKEGQRVDTETAGLLFGLGRAQLAVLHREREPEAMDNLDQAFDVFKQAGDIDNAVAVAEYPLPTGAAFLAGAGELLSGALSLVPPDSLAAGRLLTRNGWDLGRRKDDYHGAQQAFNQALAIALRQGDTKLEMDALAAAAEVDLFHFYCQESLEKSLTAIELAHQTYDLRVLVQAHRRAATAMTIIGDLEGARLHASAALAPAEKLRDRFWLDNAYWGMQVVYRLEGKWLDARKIGESSPTVSMDSRMLADRVMLEYELGDFSQGEAYLRRLLEDHGRIRPAPSIDYLMPAIVIPLAARNNSAVDGLDVARATAEAILSSISASPLVYTGARAGLAILSVLQSDVVSAQEQYTPLLSQRGTMVQTGVVTIDRVLGLLACTLGNLDQAMEHFNDALAFCRKGYRPELAWTCHDYAETLLRRNAPGDHFRATSLLAESLAISSELGMRPLMERVVALQEQLHAQPELAPAYPNGLTQREVEILRLVAAGKSNPKIAEALYISPRTVSTHVSNILNKINAANRTEAASYATRHLIT
jgi:DNA-binding CsgD family transcriptional regulator